MLKIRQQIQNGVTYAKPHVTKQRLNHNFPLSQKWNFDQSEITWPAPLRSSA